ncbi:hypothetical protein EDD16DRAFT_1498195 [Pisolithus croceorrhizus]|nr:hypothetical protein EDD16DRAFT_1498195 [Pisolithus croceorrhizus]
MPTRCADSSQTVTASRFPIAESLFQEPCLQPYIHNCEVTIVEGLTYLSILLFSSS